MSVEKRKNPRFDTLNLSYVCEDEEGVVLHEGMGRTLNISEAGILLETMCEHSPDNTLTLEIALEDELVSLTGKVVHCRQTEKVYQTGVEFSSLEGKDLVKLKKFITLFENQ